jgi:hypothetical protein
MNTAADANQEWDFFNEVQYLANGRNILVVLLNNEYVHGGVYELLLKGTSDFPTWHTSPRSEILIDNHAPNVRFKNEYEGPIDLDLPSLKTTVIVWNDRPDLAPLSKRIESLNTILRDPNYKCVIRPIGHQTARSIGNICTPI